MLNYALVFLVVGLIAGALNLAGAPAVAVQTPWTLFLTGAILGAIHLVTGAPLGFRACCPDDDVTPRSRYCFTLRRRIR